MNSPKHLGLILDGNRRWAKANGFTSLEGHKKGADLLLEMTEHVFDRGIKNLSAYVFSSENWNRSKNEVKYLMSLVSKMANDYSSKLGSKGIKIIILGRRYGLSAKTIKSIEDTESKTKDGTKGVLALCFNYGGKNEIIDAFKKAADKNVSIINPEDLDSFLYGPELPPCDMIIRTSGEKRTSGYMLWRSDYSELFFEQKNWPDFTEDDLDTYLAEYDKRQRRFGK